jgi:hypothetical protein
MEHTVKYVTELPRVFDEDIRRLSGFINYLAIPTARVSRITDTLIVPG